VPYPPIAHFPGMLSDFFILIENMSLTFLCAIPENAHVHVN